MIIPAADRLGKVEEYYFARKLREIRARDAAGEDIINLGIGNPDLMPATATLKSLVHHAVEPGAHGYQPYKGIPQLREGFASLYLNMYGVVLDAEAELLPLIGSKEGIMHISMAFLNPGDQVLVPNPGYLTYGSVSRLVGAETVLYKLDEAHDWQPDFEALEKQDLSRVKLMWVNYPHMPTGAPATDALMERLIAFGKKHQILICHDNPYSLVLNPHPKSILAYEGARDVAIELNSLSKSHNMAGWRIGMVAGNAAYINLILRVKSNMDSGMFQPLQRAAVEALALPFSWHKERNEEYAKRRVKIEELLTLLDCTFDANQVGMFVWARIPDHVKSGEAMSEEILNAARVFLTPGFIFGSQGERYIRASLCNPLHRLDTALERIRSFKMVGV
ncbi:MAG: aminotransferase class I/II-fold pyridoxal phosphate-dependent enzyme [Bacteroidota bacterium]